MRSAGLRVGIAAILLLIGFLPAFGAVRILASSGGIAADFVRLFEVVDHSGERVVIDGPCYSACTFVLSIVPSDRICVTQRAVLGFHAGQFIDAHGRTRPAPEATRLVAASYPNPVRAWIDKHGGLAAKPIFLRGRELAALYPRCS
jgi:hypothetical protein